MGVRRPSLLFFALWSTSGLAGTPELQPSATAPTLAERAARRFPQPVRVGDLIDRQVLQPTPAQHVLGRVAAIERNEKGGIDVVVRFGGFLGLGIRLIAIPVEAIALLGEHVVVMDLTPEQLRHLPVHEKNNENKLSNEDMIQVGLTKPFH